MMDFLLINKAIVVLINATGLLLAFWVYFANRTAKANKLVFWFTMCLILWINFDFISSFAHFFVPTIYVHLVSLWVARLVFIILCPFFILFYFFSIYFPRFEKRNYILDKIYISVWSILFFISFTPLIIKKVEIGREIELTEGGGMGFYLLISAVSLFLVVYNLFKKYYSLLKEEKLKIQYFLIGFNIFVIFNLIFNIVLPFFRGYGGYLDIFGNHSIIFLFGFTGLAILKRRLFEIKVILTQLLILIIAVLLFLDLVFTQQLSLQILKGAVLLSFLILGYLLIKTILGEIEEKEKLRKLTLTLEEKVKQRTKELEDRLGELERFHRLTVGRELKMIELKEEIKKLKEELEKRKPR